MSRYPAPTIHPFARLARDARLAWMLLALALVAAPAGADDTRLPTEVVPTYQAIRLTLDPAKREYTGSIRVDLEVRSAVDAIRFHAKAMDLRRVALQGAAGSTELAAAPEEHDIVAARAPSKLAPGAYTLTVEFANDFDSTAASLYRLQAGGSWYAFTQFEAIDARKAFPCWDEPSFKIPWQLTLSIPAGQEAVSNTPIESDATEKGVRTIAFAKTKPLPSYLLAIAVGPLEFVPIPGLRVPGRVVVPRGSKALASTAVAMTPPIFDACERWFEIPYPYEKLDLIAVPEFAPGAMENAGAITYADRFLLFDEKTISAESRETFAVFTAHEIAHMWFGDYVTMKWWDDLWLNESFAEWAANKIADQVHPAYRIPLRARLRVDRAFLVDGQLATHAIRRPVKTIENLYEVADDLAYNKGQAVLEMTERWIGAEAFRRGVIAYLRAHAFGNAEGKDLWNALGAASGKDVPGVLASFLDQPGVPLVTAELRGDGSVALAQRRFLNHGVTAPSKILWKIPVTLLWLSKGEPRNHTVVLDRERMSVRLPGPKPAWIHANADEGGYYRWSVDAASLRKLTAEAPTALTARERLGFVQNATGLLRSGTIRGDQYLEVLAAFSGDTNPLVLTAVAEALGDVEVAFVNEANEAAFAAYVRRVLGPALRRFGLDRAPREDESISLARPVLYAWVGDKGKDEQVLAHADSLAAAFLKNRESIDPSLVEPALQLSAIRGDSLLFHTYRYRFEMATVPSDRQSFLRALGHFRDPELRRRALEYALTGPLRPQEHFVIADEMGKTPRLRDETWAWWEANYDDLVGRMPPEYAMFVPIGAGGCSEPRLHSAERFFTNPKRQQGGVVTMLAKVAEATRDCLGLRRREGGSVDRALGVRAD